MRSVFGQLWGNFKGRLPLFLLLFGFFYVYYQLFTGERGLFTWYELNRQVEHLKLSNATLSEKKWLLERKVARITPETADKDYVDELIRRTLPLVKPQEYVLLVEWGKT